MQELLHFPNTNALQFLSKSNPSPTLPSLPSSSHLNHFPPLKLSPKSSISLQTPPKPPSPISPPSPNPNLNFHEKLLYLDSIGIDLFSLLHHHPPIISSSLQTIKSVVNFMSSMGFSAPEFRRISGMCPEILNSSVSKDLLPVFTFLLREVDVSGSDLKRVINRRPRLLACSVEKQLRPTFYYLRILGISELHKHTSLLSCSVEDKFIPRIDYFQSIGFSYRETVSMVRRFPHLFCYSIKGNFEPKFEFFVVDMGRELKELLEFPQYFSYSLEDRIKPRHLCLVEKNVYFPLSVMLKTSDKQFRRRLEMTVSSSLPLKSSPLWRSGLCDSESKFSGHVACTNLDLLQCV